jgi:hypothetical protein
MIELSCRLHEFGEYSRQRYACIDYDSALMSSLAISRIGGA